MGAANATRACIDRDHDDKVDEKLWQQRARALEVENHRLRAKVRKLRDGTSFSRRVSFEPADSEPRSPTLCSPKAFFPTTSAEAKSSGSGELIYINHLLQQLWPSMRQFFEDVVLKGIVESALRNRVWAPLRFLRVSLGSEAPRALRSRAMMSKASVVELVVDVAFAGDIVEVSLQIDTERQAEVDKLAVQGTLAIELHMSSGTASSAASVGASVCFFNKPDVYVSFVEPLGAMADRLNMAGEVIQELVSSELVIPNRVALSLASTSIPACAPLSPPSSPPASPSSSSTLPRPLHELWAVWPHYVLVVRLSRVTWALQQAEEPSDTEDSQSRGLDQQRGQPKDEMSLGPGIRHATITVSLGGETWITPTIPTLERMESARTDLSHAFFVDSLSAQALSVNVFSMPSGDEDVQETHLGTLRVSILKLMKQCSGGWGVFDVELQQQVQQASTAGTGENRVSAGESSIADLYSRNPTVELHLSAQIHNLQPSNLQLALPIANRDLRAAGVLLFAVDCVRDLPAKCDGHLVELEVKLLSGSIAADSATMPSSCCCQTKRGIATRLGHQAFAEKQQQAAYLLDGEPKGKIGEDKMAWLLGFADHEFRAIAHHSIEVRFRHVFRFLVEDPAKEIMTMDIRRCQGRGSSLAQYNLELAELLQQPGQALTMQQRPMEAGTRRRALSHQIPNFVAKAQWLSFGGAMPPEELAHLVKLDAISNGSRRRKEDELAVQVGLGGEKQGRVRLHSLSAVSLAQTSESGQEHGYDTDISAASFD